MWETKCNQALPNITKRPNITKGNNCKWVFDQMIWYCIALLSKVKPSKLTYILLRLITFGYARTFKLAFSEFSYIWMSSNLTLHYITALLYIWMPSNLTLHSALISDSHLKPRWCGLFWLRSQAKQCILSRIAYTKRNYV